MRLIPVPTPLLSKGDDLVEPIIRAGLAHGDIVVVSSKAVATIEGRLIRLSTITPSTEAEEWSRRCGRSPAFRQAVLDEAERMNGRILPGCPEAMLTELKPTGLPSGVILVANAGLDESNAPEGFAVGWPADPVASVRRLCREIEKCLPPAPAPATGRGLGIGTILSDSTCRPRRFGVTAMALTVSGLDPLRSLVGTHDLYGKELQMTQEAIADQLATAANILMGNAAESIPAVIIRDHGIPLSDYEGWVPGIEPEEDLFGGYAGSS
jgi:coenzyme F420-0:L-glutamate ligase / coenzyme F420-1:gamma-L-glutamate ligase